MPDPGTIGTAKITTIGQQIAAASTVDGSGFYNVDTTTASFTTTLAAAVITGQQERFKQANGSWGVNAWTLTSSLASGIKMMSSAGVVGAGVTSLTFNSNEVAEVVAEWDGAAWQVTQIMAVRGGFVAEQSLTIATQNTIPALSVAWNGIGVPYLTINNTIFQNGSGVTFTANSTAVTFTPATAGFNLNIGDIVSAFYLA